MSKRARITDSDPLNRTDGVIDRYEQVASQPAERFVSPEQADKLESQPVKKSTSQESSNLASQQVSQQDTSIPQGGGYENAPHQEKVDERDLVAASQEVNNSTIQPPNKSASQQVNHLTSQESDHPTTQLLDNPNATEQVDLEERTSQQSSKSTSQEVDNLASQEADHLAGQPSNKSVIDRDDDSSSTETSKSTSQPVSKSVLRKATFKLDSEVLTALDRYHLQLQIDLGKQDAPYKETIVEEAIAQWLERSEKSRERVIKSLAKRQERR